MAYVVCQPCIGTKDRSCVEVCPVDCFYDIHDPKLNQKSGLQPTKKRKRKLENGQEVEELDFGMMTINPDECINCGACETECPVEAIFEDTGVPEKWKEYTKLNEEITQALSDEQLDAARCTSKGD